MGQSTSALRLRSDDLLGISQGIIAGDARPSRRLPQPGKVTKSWTRFLSHRLAQNRTTNEQAGLCRARLLR
jgi:hypothetical protein